MGDGPGVDDRRAVDLPELLGVEFGLEILECAADQRLAARGDHPRVLQIGLEEEHIVHRNQPHLISDCGLHPAQARGVAFAQGRGHLRQRGGQGLRRRRGGQHALAQPRHRLGQPRFGRRLEHVVDRAALEGIQCVLAVRGDERDVRQALHLGRRGQTVHAGHFDVEEGDVGPVLHDRAYGFFAMTRLGHDAQLRPQGSEAVAQLRTQQRFVVGDDGARHGRPPWQRRDWGAHPRSARRAASVSPACHGEVGRPVRARRARRRRA